LRGGSEGLALVCGAVFAEFEVPVGGVDEVIPAFVEGGSEGEVDEGAPLWAPPEVVWVGLLSFLSELV
jgi:hypothetical protein